MANKPFTAHLNRMVRHVMQTLPDSRSQALEILRTLMVILPRTYPHRDEIVAQIETLRAAEEHQAKFVELLKETA